MDLVSKSETIGVSEITKLMYMSNTMAKMLTMDEFLAIITVYNGAINRLLKENGVEK